ncbi:MAG: type II toxin-antitoxin system VapC family toxin [Gammaproteobacteria bacterium]|nr:MAG: type II toxin-antitoxin system VapC family toxin [Gammaproteobacteria bacterium]
MILLLDTQLLLWAASEPHRLSPAAQDKLLDPDNTPWFSAASIWEVTIKAGLGHSDFRVDPFLLRRGLIDNGYQELPITSRHALGVHHLPSIHRDPFDRLLLAQAESEGMLLLTTDATVARYPAPVLLV